MSRTRVVPDEEGGIAQKAGQLAQRCAAHGPESLEWGEVFPRSSYEDRLQPEFLMHVPRQL